MHVELLNLAGLIIFRGGNEVKSMRRNAPVWPVPPLARRVKTRSSGSSLVIFQPITPWKIMMGKSRKRKPVGAKITGEENGHRNGIVKTGIPPCAEQLDDAQTIASNGNAPRYFYAVANGKKPGIYNDLEEVQKQNGSLSDICYCNFTSRAAAVDYLRIKGLSDSKIRFFLTTFIKLPNFTPDPTASFKDEFERLASSQQMSQDVKRKAKTLSLHDQIVQYFLPDGVRYDPDADDDDDEIYLNDDEALQIYQAMCRLAHKPVHSTMNPCLIELKKRPYVNIMDFVDTYRTGQPVRTFENWHRFKKYTFDGRTIDIESARENEFLAPLLQSLRNPSQTVDPIKSRRLLRQKREARRKAKREAKQRMRANQVQCVPTKSALDLPRCLSPTPSRSPTPPIKAEGASSTTLVKIEPFSSSADSLCQVDNPSKPPLRPATLNSETGSPLLVSSAPMSEISDTDLFELEVKLEQSTQNSIMQLTADEEVEVLDLTELGDEEDRTTRKSLTAASSSTSLKRHWASTAPENGHPKRQRPNNANTHKTLCADFPTTQ